MSKTAATPATGFINGDFNDALFKQLVQKISLKYRYSTFEAIAFSDDTGISANILASGDDSMKRVLGLRAFKVTYRATDDNNNDDKSMNVIFKIKPKGNDTWQSVIAAVRMGGEVEIADNYSHKQFDCFYGNELKELACVQTDSAIWKALMPDIYWSKQDVSRDIYAIAMEDLRQERITHLNTIGDVSCWSESDINIVLQEIASFHAIYYGKTDKIPANIKASLTDLGSMTQTYTNDVISTFIRLQLASNTEKLPHLLGDNISRIIKNSLANVKEVCTILDNSPLTLVHSDFNVRNVCLRTSPRADQSRLCVFDWEMVRVANPQHDVAEFLAFVLPEDVPVNTWKRYAEVYRIALLDQLTKQGASDDVIKSVSDESRYQQVFDMCLLELAWNRIGTYMRVHTTMFKLPYISRLVGNVFKYIESFSNRYSFLNSK